MPVLNRREFLASIVATAFVRGAALPRVIIAGAGLAGLCCAYELQKRGYDVVVIEGRSRPGGRVETLREGFAAGITAETGATRIPSTHEVTLAYVREFGLKLAPFKPGGFRDVFHVRGKNFTLHDGKEPEWPLRLSPDERRLGMLGMEDRYLFPPLIRSRGCERSPSVPKPIAALDRLTLQQYLGQQGLTADAIELLTLGIAPDISASLFLLVAFNEQAHEFFHIQGGNDQLPNAFAERLGARIHYGTRAISIGQSDNCAWVVVEHAGRRQTLVGEHVVCALPFSMARNMFAEGRLSAQKEQVIREQKYFPVEKVFLQMKEQYWKKHGLSGFATSDLISERFWSIADCGPDNRGLLLSYLVGKNAQRLDQKVEADRLELTLADAESIFPGATKHYEGGRSKSWAQDPWQRGGLAQFDPGQIGFIPVSARPEGRIHFAGEHTSRWTGWMQGALESAQRVVQEITR